MELDALNLAQSLSTEVRAVFVCKEDTFLHRSAIKRFEGTPVTVVPINFWRHAFSMAIVREARRMVRRYRIRNVVFFGSSEMKSLYFAFWGMTLNVIVRHGTTKSSSKKDPLHRLVFSRVGHHVSCSQHLAENVRTIFPIAKHAKGHIIYPSLHTHVSLKREVQSGPVRLLHVGRFAPGKGQVDAVQACRSLIEAGVSFRFNLIGAHVKTDIMAAVEKAIAATGSTDSFNLIDHVDDVIPFLKEADIFLFPSYGETFGNAFNEGLASGLACIAYDNTVFPELAELGLYFHRVPTGDVAALAETLVRVTKDLVAERLKAEKNIATCEAFFAASRERLEWLALLE